MMELMNNARLGWMEYTESGKLAALLLLALLWFWFGCREHRSRYLALLVYTTVMAVCCICPLTAAVLMTYQTRFYDYQWIWSLVPLTIVIALGGTLLRSELLQTYANGRAGKRRAIGITAVMLAVICLCAPLLQNTRNTQNTVAGQTETAKVLELLWEDKEDKEDKEITLWAPRMIMEYVRTLDGSIRMPYGRNMWDPALNAYAYDTYGEAEESLYRWMCSAEETGEGENLAEAMDLAKQLGVTHLLLPGILQPEVLTELESYLGVQAQTVENYYLLELSSQ